MQNHLNNISELRLKRRVNQNGCSTFASSFKSIEYILRLWQRFALAPYFGHFIERKTILWPRFPIFPYFSKIKIRWNLLIWFLDLGHLRVSLGKIWAICQMGRWPVLLDPKWLSVPQKFYSDSLCWILLSLKR